MTNRSYTSRNLLGGFFGGILGILAFALIHPSLLPAGCLLGVVIGFWYQEIWINAKADYVRTCTRWETAYEKTVLLPYARLRALSRKIKRSNIAIPSPRFRFAALRLYVQMRRFKNKCRTGAGSLIHGIGNALRWPIKSDKHGVLTVSLATSLIYAGLIVWIVLPIIWMYEYDFHNRDSSAYCMGGFLTLLLGMCPFMGAFAGITVGLAGNEKEADKFTADCVARYQRYGLPYLLIHQFFYMGKWLILGLIWELCAILYFLLGIVCVIGFMVLPMVFAMFVVRHTWSFVSRKDHWSCFGVTLIVTTISALTLTSYLHGAWLWVIALATGCISGITSEAIRRMIHATLEARPEVMVWARRKFDDEFDDLIIPVWRKRWSPILGLIQRIPNPLAEAYK